VAVPESAESHWLKVSLVSFMLESFLVLLFSCLCLVPIKLCKQMGKSQATR
jgi:hypothetical protein